MSEAQAGIWDEDLLGREREARMLEHFVLGQLESRGRAGKKRSYVLNLDAGWGYGKTFFLERFARQLRASGHLVAEVNAWENDHAEDPFVLLVSAVDAVVAPLTKSRERAVVAWQAVKRNAGTILVAGAKGAATTFLRRTFGEAWDEIVEVASGAVPGESPNSELTRATLNAGLSAMSEQAEASMSEAIAGFRFSEAASRDFKDKLSETLGELAEEAEEPRYLFVLVDEIDRCRPNFAIEFLERAKHLFDAEGVIFIFATNVDQIRHSVRVIYGSEFAAEQYLFRFFDRTYRFDVPERQDFVAARLRNFGPSIKTFQFQETSPAQFVTAWADWLGVSLRDIDQALDIAQTAVQLKGTRNKFEIGSLFALAVIFHYFREVGWNNFLEKLREVKLMTGARGPVPVIKVHDFEGRYVSADMDQIARTIADIGLKTVKEMHEAQLGSWVYNWLRSEAQERGIARADQAQRARWSFSEYPDLIRAASRFLPDNETGSSS